MSEIMESYQDECESLPQEPAAESFATIGSVYADGISLVFDGESAASAKHYKCNQYCKFAAGQRVYLQKDGGTYVVLFPVGAPTSVAADTATSATSAASATKADSATKATTATSATKATSADTAATATNADKATQATGVKNQAGYADIQFYAANSNLLKYRVGSSGSWISLANA